MRLQHFIPLKLSPSRIRCAVLLLLGCSILWSGCKEENLRVPLGNDASAPGQISNIRIERLAGGARLTYAIPKDMDFLYVQADYDIRPGVPGQAVASSYKNWMVIQGFGDTSVHQISLSVVDRSGNESEPVTVDVKPLLAPVQAAYDSLAYEADFGGIHVSTSNSTQGDLVLSTIYKDSTGEWVDYDRHYTGLPGIDYSVRGLPSVPTTFGVYIQDRWGNYSDTLVQEFTPYYEVLLDKSKFTAVTNLPNDTKSTWSLSGLWDGKAPESTGYSGFHAPGGVGLPMSFTFSLGVKARLSRFRTFQVHNDREYSSGNIKQFELWGSNDPSPDGSFDSWTLLQTCEVVKPSGLPGTQLSNEDKETAEAGDEFTLPLNSPPVKYLRINIISTFASPPNAARADAWLLEVSFWGEEVK